MICQAEKGFVFKYFFLTDEFLEIWNIFFGYFAKPPFFLGIDAIFV